jgi:hypothetical protein
MASRAGSTIDGPYGSVIGSVSTFSSGFTDCPAHKPALLLELAWEPNLSTHPKNQTYQLERPKWKRSTTWHLNKDLHCLPPNVQRLNQMSILKKHHTPNTTR